MGKIVCKIDMNSGLRYKRFNAISFVGNLCLFIVWPFGVFLKSVFNLNRTESLIIVFLSSVLFGWSITILNNDIGMDFYITTQRFLHGQYLSFEDFLLAIKNILLGVGEEKDVYQNILIYIVGLFSKNYHLFWSIAAIIFSFFYIKSLQFIVYDSKYKTSYYYLLIVLMFTLPANIVTLTGLRFWTAAWIAIYSSLQILLNKNNRFFLLLLLTPYIHLGFWFYLFIFLLYIISVRYVRIWYYIFFISIPISYLSINSFELNISVLPLNLQILAANYLSNETFSIYNSSGSGWRWMQTLFDNLVATYYNIILIIFFFNRNCNFGEKKIESNSVFKFVFILSAISNMLLILPYIGIRFRYISWIFISLIIFKYFGNSYKFKSLVYIYPFISIFDIWVFFRNMFKILPLDFFYNSFPFLIIDKLS